MSEHDPPSPQFAHPWTDPQSLSHLHQSVLQQPACCPSWRCGWPGSQLQILGTHWQCSKSHHSCCGRSLLAPGNKKMVCQCLHSTNQPLLHFTTLKSSCPNACEGNLSPHPHRCPHNVIVRVQKCSVLTPYLSSTMYSQSHPLACSCQPDQRGEWHPWSGAACRQLPSQGSPGF